MILAILASLILWPVYLALFLVLAIIGLPVIAFLSLVRGWYWRPSYFPQFRGPSGEERRAVWWGGWITWVWGNEEDGVVGPIWWRQRTGTDSHYIGHSRTLRMAWATFRWSALRNPVNNLRFIPVLCPRIEPKRIRSRKWEGGAFTWQGLYAGVIHFPVIRGHAYRFWLGWKLKPEDVDGVADDDMRKVRCGFAIQFKRI